MKQFSVNISTIFTEYPFLERFSKAKEAGFSHVECQFPYGFKIDDIKEQLLKNKLSLVLINFSPGNWEDEDRGIAIYPERTEEFKKSVELGVRYAHELGCKQIHCMAGILSNEHDEATAKETYKKNLVYAASRAEEYGITILIEPINTIDIKGYFLNSVEQAALILDELKLENVKMQFDFYHCQKSNGNLLDTFEQYIQYVQHVQIADVPGRHEPGTGEIAYTHIFKRLNVWAYPGFIGLEYTPQGKSEDSFAWIEEDSK